MGRFLLFLFTNIFCISLVAQRAATDTVTSGKMLNIISSEKYMLLDKDTSGKFVALVGHAVVQQGKTIFSADSIVLNEKENVMEAFGNVYITMPIA